jgi:hypothetical protein
MPRLTKVDINENYLPKTKYCEKNIIKLLKLVVLDLLYSVCLVAVLSRLAECRLAMRSG